MVVKSKCFWDTKRTLKEKINYSIDTLSLSSLLLTSLLKRASFFTEKGIFLITMAVGIISSESALLIGVGETGREAGREGGRDEGRDEGREEGREPGALPTSYH